MNFNKLSDAGEEGQIDFGHDRSGGPAHSGAAEARRQGRLAAEEAPLNVAEAAELSRVRFLLLQWTR